MLTDRGSEYCGNPERHEYELYLAVEDIDHSRTKTKSPQTNGICERFHKTVLNEFYRVAFRKKIYRSIDELQADLDMWFASTMYKGRIRDVGASENADADVPRRDAGGEGEDDRSLTVSELGILRTRMLEPLVRRRGGGLRISVPIGYIWHREIGLGFDPDLRVQEAIRVIFSRSRQLGSARQVHLSLRAEIHPAPVGRQEVDRV